MISKFDELKVKYTYIDYPGGAIKMRLTNNAKKSDYILSNVILS
jgi:hypothetical protein